MSTQVLLDRRNFWDAVAQEMGIEYFMSQEARRNDFDIKKNKVFENITIFNLMY